LIERKGASALTEVDGGVNKEKAKDIIKAGADAMVAGSSNFSSEDPVKTVKELKNKLRR
jgi:ribulose-phosphate 3-epimerase